MRKRLLALAVLALLAPALLRAQQGPRGNDPDGGTVNPRQLAEDIEIMRRLLGRTLADAQMQACMSCHVRQVRFAPDGKVLSGHASAGVRLWDADPSSPCPAIRALAFSPDGKTLLTGSRDGTVRIWDAATGKQLSTHPGTAHGLGALEGVYLKGYGVLYTMTLPPQPHPVKPPPAKPAAKPLSDWERVRKELRGDKADEPAPTPAVPPSLADLILHVLARNGQHFSQLSAKERITVVVTFREPHEHVGQTSMASAGLLALKGAGLPMAGGGTPMGPMGQGPRNPMGDQTGPPGTPPTRAGQRPGTTARGAVPDQTGPPGTPPTRGLFDKKPTPSSARDHELVGDLHLKQGHTPEAVKAYTSALNALADERGPASDAHRRTLYRKLAQAYLGMADRTPDSHEKVIARAIEFLRRATLEKAAEPPAASARLPAKLIVFATKGLLDQVGSGKLTFEQFRQLAGVESVPALTLDRPPARKGK
jgi:hypothetical protein